MDRPTNGDHCSYCTCTCTIPSYLPPLKKRLRMSNWVVCHITFSINMPMLKCKKTESLVCPQTFICYNLYTHNTILTYHAMYNRVPFLQELCGQLFVFSPSRPGPKHFLVQLTTTRSLQNCLITSINTDSDEKQSWTLGEPHPWKSIIKYYTICFEPALFLFRN